jgi:hypothetical protein
MPQYLKPIHDVDFQGDTAEQTKKIWKKTEYKLRFMDHVRSGCVPIAMQITVTESAPTILDLAASK